MNYVNGTLGIVIPTKDRFEFVSTQLSYYAEINCPYRIYIGDSSGANDLAKTRRLIDNLGSRVAVSHIILPGSNDHEAIFEVLKNVTEPYSAVIGDDDFLVPSGLEKCVNFIATHSEFSTVHGVASILSSYDQLTGSVKGYGAYDLKSEENDDASSRLISFMDNYYETVFSVHRTEQFRAQISSTLSISWSGLRDLLACCLSIVHGKSKKLDCFYLVRQAHPAQNPERMDLIDWTLFWDIVLDVVFSSQKRHKRVPKPVEFEMQMFVV